MEDRKLSCDDAARAIVRWSDGTLEGGARAALEAHLATCADCRAALETQRAVAAWLRSRPVDRVSDQFAAQLAARLDGDSGWFGIADWRVWTLRLTPVAALLAAFVLLGSAQSDSRVTLDEWALDADDTSSWFLQTDVSPDASLDALVESIVTGDDPVGSGGANDVGK
jgi:anti-sigma factor RsiW